MDEDDKMTDLEFAAKVEWKGGVVDALGYGMKSRHLENQDSDLARAWKEVEEAAAEFDRLVYRALNEIDKVLEAADEEEGD